MALGRNVAALRKRLKLTHEQIGAGVGTSAQNISNMESRDSRRSAYASRLADYFAIDLRTLEDDDFDIDALPPDQLRRVQQSVRSRVAAMDPAAEYNVENAPRATGKVPLISWTTAGAWGEIQDVFQPGVADEWVAPTVQTGPRAFALRVVGDSMFKADDPRSIPDGAEVIIDPDKGPAHGKIVLAKRTGEQQATLKLLWYDGTQPYLKPLNDRYPLLEMTPDTRIIGVAVEYIMRRRL